MRPPYTHASQARQILNDAEDDLRDWRIDGLLGMLSDEGEAKAKQTNQQVSNQGHGKQKGKGKDADKENRREGDKGSVVGTESGSIGASVKEIECGH